MIVLALDTTSRSGSVALASGDELLEAKAVEAPDGFGQVVYQEIRDLLQKHGVGLAQVDCYAGATGPGSFTGIRIGLTAVKALADVHGKPVVGVSNLRAFASCVAGAYRVPVMDARRGEVYAAVYDGELQAVVPEVVTSWDKFLDLLGGREVTFAATNGELFGADGVAPLTGQGSKREVVVEPLAGAVARLAMVECREGRAIAPEALDANYVRRTDAELNWKDPAAERGVDGRTELASTIQVRFRKPNSEPRA